MLERHDPIEIPIPVLTRLLPSARPYSDPEAIRSAAEAFWSAPGSRRLLPDPAAFEAYRAQRAFEFTVWSYPALTPARLPLVVALNEFGYAFDSVFDDADLSAHSTTSTGEGQAADQGLSRYLDVFTDLAHRAQAVLSPPQYERLMAAVAITVNCLVNHHHSDLAQRSSRDIYHEHLNSGWIWVAQIVLELAIDVDLSAYFSHDSLLKQYYHAACSTGVLVNQIFSLRKEYYCEGGVPTVIPALARERGISFAEATTAVGEWTLREEQRCYDLRARVLTSPMGEDPSVRAFITAVEFFLAGNLQWSRLTPRYHGTGFEYAGTTHGTMVFHPDRTIYVPAGSSSVGAAPNRRSRRA